MKLLYRIRDIGIYIDDMDIPQRQAILVALHNQLKGCDRNLDEEGVQKKLVFHDFAQLPDFITQKASIVPGSSIFSDGIFSELEQKVAFRVRDGVVDFWMDKYSWVSVPYLIQMLLLQDGKTFVHSAGISVNGKGILVPAFGGIGKTAVVSQALKHDGVRLLGDDLVIVSRDGYLEGYERPFCLYAYHKVLFPEYFAAHRMRFRKRTLLNQLIARAKKELGIVEHVNYDYVTVPPSRLFNADKIETQKIPLTTVCMVKRYVGLDQIEITYITDKDSVVDFCTAVIFHEWHGLLKMLFNYMAQSQQPVSLFFRLVENILRGAVSNVDDIRIAAVPDKMPVKEVADALCDLVMQ